MTSRIEISRREEIPPWLGYGTPVVTVLAALIVGAVPLVLIKTDPVTVYRNMFIGSVSDISTLVNVLIRAVPLFLAALAVYVPLKSGLWNIAAEGQIYLGGIVAVWIGTTYSAPTYVLVPAMALGAIVVGVVSGLIPAYLRIKYDLNEIIVTLMITFAAVELNSYMVRGPLQASGGVPLSKSLPEAATLPVVGGTDFHFGVFLLFFGAIGVYYLIQHSPIGYEILMIGSGPDAVESSPISKHRIFLLTMAVGGAIACVAGMVQIAGVRGNIVTSWSPQYGFIAIPIALLGINGAFRVLGASLFFAVLFVGGNSISVTSNVPFSIVNILIALIFLFLITSEFFKKFQVSLNQKDPSGGDIDE